MLMQYEIDHSKEDRSEQRKESCIREFIHNGQKAVPERTDDEQRTLHINLPLAYAPPVYLNQLTKTGNFTHQTGLVGAAVKLTASGSRVTTASAGAYTKHESELVPATIVVGLIDTHAIDKQTDKECEGCNQAVPKATPKPSRVCIRLLVLRV